MNSLTKPVSPNTYELGERPYRSNFMSFKTDENISNRDLERFSQSPPIILCETSDNRNSRTHRHRYLFYPSISRLSPYTDDKYLSNFGKFSQTNTNKNNNFDIEQEINKLRIQSNRNYKSNEEGKTSGNNKRSESFNYPIREGKYDDLLKKSNELMNSISNLVKEEEGKIKGPLGYYNHTNGINDRNSEYDRFIDRKNNLFKTENNNNNERNNYDPQFEKTYGQNYSGTLGNRRNFRLGSSENNIDNRNDEYNNDFKSDKYSNTNKNNQYNDNNNFSNTNNDFNNNNNDNFEDPLKNKIPDHKRYYQENNTIEIPLKHKIHDDEDFKNNDKNNIIKNNNNRNKNDINIERIYNDKNDVYLNKDNNIRKYQNNRDDENNNIFSNENNNNNDLKSKTMGNNNIKGYSTNNKNFLLEGDNDINHQDYNDNNRISSNDNTKKEYIIGKGFNTNFGEESIKNPYENYRLNEENNLRGIKDNKNNNIDDGKNTLSNSNGHNFILNKNTDSLMNSNNKNNFAKTGNNFGINNNQEDLMNTNIKNLAFSDTNINFNAQKGTKNFDDEESISSKEKNKNKNNPNIYMTHSPISYEEVKAKNGNKNNNMEENKNPNKLSDKEKEQNIKLVLVDDKDRQILSEDRKPFIGEEAERKIEQNNEIYILTKDGQKIPVAYIRNYEGEYLVDKNGNPILGNGNFYFVDKNGEIIFSTNKKILEGDKAVPVIITKKKFDPYGSILTATFNNDYEYNSDKNIGFMDSLGIEKLRGNILGEGIKNSQRFGYNTTLGISGGGKGIGVNEYKKRTYKNRLKIFPAGDGDAKAPILKKRRRKFKK